MANRGSEWETVRKPGRKNKNQTANGLSKVQKKLLAEKMPRINTAPPVRESPTIFDAFMEKDPPPKPEKVTGNGTAQPKKTPHPPKRKPAEQKSKPTTMTEAVKQIQLSDLQTVLTKVQTTFPGNPSVWLKDLASILNLKMDRVPEPDPVFQGKPADYPLCMLSGPIKKLLRETINQCSADTLQHFLEHCIQAMVADMKQGVSTYGYRMFIQLLLHDKPHIILPNLNKYHELMKVNQNRALRCLSIMWAVGQAGVTRFDIGLRVWLQLMFNTLNIRSLSAYSVEYIENLFQLHKNLKPGMSILKEKDFFNIMDVFFTPQPSLPSNLQKRIQAVFPKLQRVAFGMNPENRLRIFFPHFLNRATSSNKHIQKEAISGLVRCLSVDKGSFSEWRQMYTKNNLQKSGVLLQHLCKNWDTVSKVMDKKKLYETISSFNVTNEDMAAKEKMQNVEGFRLCLTTCKELLAKMNQSPVSWRLFITLVLAVLSGIVFYDVFVHQGYTNSRTYQILNDSGFLFFLEQVNNRTKIYTHKTSVWLQDNVPIYYAKTCEFVGPYLQLFWEKLFDLGIYIAEVTKPGRDWLNAKIPVLLEWLQEKAPIIWNTVWTYLSVILSYVLSALFVVWQYLVYFINITGTWLMENVFVGKLSPENILHTLSEVLAFIQTCMVNLVQWLVGLMSNIQGAETMAAKHD